MPRLFVAIDLPEQIRIPLSQMTREIPGARSVGSSEIHLTLRFIGEVPPETFSRIKAALATVSFAPFPLAVTGVGHFPPHGHPRVLWVGLTGGPELGRLQQLVEAAVQQAGLPAEERPFSPHVTLARLKETPASAVAGFEAARRALAFDPFEVNQFTLYSSVLSPRGATHEKEAVYRCGGT